MTSGVRQAIGIYQGMINAFDKDIIALYCKDLKPLFLFENPYLQYDNNN